MTAWDVITLVFVVGGLFFLLIGGIGLVRFPGFYTRLHPAGKSDTLGASLVLMGLAIHAGWSLVALKLILIQLFIVLANPAATHAIGRAAYKSGLVPWRNKARAPRGDRE